MTNQVWQPSELCRFYPRGHDALRKPFEVFNSKDTQNWFTDRGVRLKTEPDGRVFPVSDRSETIANMLISESQRLGVRTITSTRVTGLFHKNKEWELDTNQGTFYANKVVLATGGNPLVWRFLDKLGFLIEPPVPSLFTFKCKSPLLDQLAGISLPEATVKINGTNVSQSGPILITHEGLSGPAILKLSAWGARELSDQNYTFDIRINWLGISHEDLTNAIRSEQQNNPKKYVVKNPVAGVPKRFWARVTSLCDIPETRNYAEIGKKQINRLCDILLASTIHVFGKSTNKEEFVTAGGVVLDEIDLNTFSSKKYPNLYLAGEVLNIDAVTGGFNFQAAWTGGYIAGNSL